MKDHIFFAQRSELAVIGFFHSGTLRLEKTQAVLLVARLLEE
jgi:hypothetical protein